MRLRKSIYKMTPAELLDEADDQRSRIESRCVGGCSRACTETDAIGGSHNYEFRARILESLAYDNTDGPGSDE